MVSRLDLYTPINVLKPVAENLWVVDGPEIEMAYFGGSIPFTTRMTVVRLENRDLFLHSPLPFNAELARVLEELGVIRHLVSPSKIHYAGIESWHRHYPNALSWASPGVRERARGQNITVTFDRDIPEGAPADWAVEMDQLRIKGSAYFSEEVFFHRSSKTLILTDLIENFELQKVRSRFFRFLLRAVGSVHPDGKMPLDVRATFWGHKKELRACVERIIAWNPEKVILSHGKWYPQNGVQELRRAFRWLLET